MGQLDLYLEASEPPAPPAGYLRFFQIGTTLKHKDSSGTVITYAAGLTQEQVEDYVGSLLTDSSTVNVTYNDAGNQVTFDVIASAVDHDALLNFVANEHVNHASVSITAGTGLSGGGDITATRTLNIANTAVTAGTYGSTTALPVIVINAQGQITSASNQTITPANIGAQLADADLTAIAALAGTGVVSRTGAGTAAVRTIVAGDTSLAVTNGDGVSGNPSIVVQPGNINHNALLNGGGNTHIDHSAVSINAGTYLSGGGDITATRTINHANSAVTPATYGGINAIPVLGIGATGHVDSASTVNPTAALLTGLGAGSNISISATDTILAALANIQAQLNAVSSASAWTELVKVGDTIVSSNTTFTNITDLQFTATAGRNYYMEFTLLFRTAATGTGFAVTMNTSDTAVGDCALQVNMPIAADGTAALYTGSISAFGDVVVSTGVQTVQPTWFICNMKGIFRCTTSGTVLPQFRSEVNGSNVNCGGGSVALIREFA